MITTPGAVDANSYVSLDEADMFFASSVKNSSWPESDELKEAALIESTRLLDSQFNWFGKIAADDQALRWPRSDVYDADNRLIPSDAIPKQIKDAVCNLAYYLVESGGLEQSQSDILGVKVGPIDIRFAAESTTIGVPRFIARSLKSFGSFLGIIQGSAYSVNALRS